MGLVQIVLLIHFVQIVFLLQAAPSAVGLLKIMTILLFCFIKTPLWFHDKRDDNMSLMTMITGDFQ